MLQLSESGMTKRRREAVEQGVRWHAVFTQPRKEAEADRNLRRLGFYTFYPFRRERCRRRRQNADAFRVEWIERAYFACYTFVAVRQGEALGHVGDVDGALSVVKTPQGEYLEIPHAVMDELMERADDDGLIESVDKTQRKRLMPGQMVHFETGSPFAGLLAQVELDSGKEIRLWVKSLRARVRVRPSAIAEIAN